MTPAVQPRRASRTWLWLCALVLGLWTAAPARAEVAAADAEALLRLTGIWDQLDGLPQQVADGFVAGMRTAGREPTAEDEERIRRLVQGVYAAPRMRALMIQTVGTMGRAPEVRSVLRWYDSAPGKALAEADAAAARAGPETPQQLTQAAAELQAMPEARRQLLQAILRDSRGAELVAQLFFSTAMATVRGLRSLQPQAPGVSADDVARDLEAQRPQMLQAAGTYLMVVMTRRYRTLSDSHLAQYGELLGSPSGQHVNLLMFQAIEAAMVDAAEELGRQLPSLSPGASS